MLHLVNKSPFSSKVFDLVGRFLSDGDILFLYEDAVLAAAAGTAYENRLKEIAGGRDVFALQADLKARGITKVSEKVKVVDYGGFVDLVAGNKTHTWLQ